MEVLAFALHDVGKALEEVDDLDLLDRDRRLLQGLAASVFESHLSHMPLLSSRACRPTCGSWMTSSALSSRW